MIKIHVLNGSPARIATPDTALTTLADMLGCSASELRADSAGWVSRWSYRCAGEIVGHIQDGGVQ